MRRLWISLVHNNVHKRSWDAHYDAKDTDLEIWLNCDESYYGFLKMHNGPYLGKWELVYHYGSATFHFTIDDHYVDITSSRGIGSFRWDLSARL